MLVHCSDGIGRTGTYILLDLVISRMLKGAKEMDIAATLEHLRDQRAGLVSTKVSGAAESVFDVSHNGPKTVNLLSSIEIL